MIYQGGVSLNISLLNISLLNISLLNTSLLQNDISGWCIPEHFITEHFITKHFITAKWYIGVHRWCIPGLKFHQPRAAISWLILCSKQGPKLTANSFTCTKSRKTLGRKCFLTLFSSRGGVWSSMPRINTSSKEHNCTQTTLNWTLNSELKSTLGL